jgi:transcriptional regulator with XRE-family HTH domain
MTPEQCRQARALLGWRAQRLGLRSSTCAATVRRFERGDAQPHPAKVEAIRAALVAAGVEFINQNGSEPSVRLRAPCA